MRLVIKDIENKRKVDKTYNFKNINFPIRQMGEGAIEQQLVTGLLHKINSF